MYDRQYNQPDYSKTIYKCILIKLKNDVVYNLLKIYIHNTTSQIIFDLDTTVIEPSTSHIKNTNDNDK